MEPKHRAEVSENAFQPELDQTSAEMISAVYEELRDVARGQMARESGPQTLSATALVHEAWLRVRGEVRWQSRRHFFGAAGVAMRRILIERARSKASLKRGGEFERVELDVIDVATPTTDAALLELDEALSKLTREDPAVAEIVSLRYFTGLKWSEIADLTGTPERDLGRQWEYARAWLRAEIKG